jgi:sialic acid synthase
MRHGMSARRLTIDGFEISDASRCYVIAEIGHNHMGSVETCKELFQAARYCGVNAVKLQKRDNRSLYTHAFYNRPYESEESYGPTYGSHREALEFGRDEYLELQAFARELGLAFFATAFDFASADLLAELDMPAFKMASGDLTNTPLLRYVADIGKPMIISTGGAVLDDVRRGYESVAEVNSDVAILQCTAGYPADWKELDLKVIETYRECARIVEKHFTLNRAWKGTDHKFSLEPQGMRKLVRDLDRAFVALGDGTKTMYASEADPIRKMGKMIVVARDLPAGHVVARDDLALKSPADGLPPYELDRVVGRTLRHPVSEDMPLRFEDLEEQLLPVSEPVASAAGDDG